MTPRPWADTVARANATAKQPVLFILDPSMTATAWDRWIEIMEEAGYSSLALAGIAGLSGVIREASEVAQALSSRPAVVGSGLGGLVAQILMAECRSAASVAVSPVPPPPGWSANPPRARAPGPVLVIAGDQDAPPEPRSAGPELGCERLVLPGYGPDLLGGPRWRVAADAALTFIQRFV